MSNAVAVVNYGHLGKVLWGSERISEFIDLEDERLEKYPGFKVGWDFEAYTFDILAEEDPALLQKLVNLRKKYPERVGMGTSTYGQPLSCYVGCESNARQLVEAVRSVERHFGCRPVLYTMSEHAAHAQMPQLIAAAGFEGALMRTHFMMYGLNPEVDASCVTWTGLDRSVGVRTIPTYVGESCYCAINGYTHDWRTLEGTPFGFNTMDNKILLDGPDAPYTLDDFRDQFAPRIKHPVASRIDDPRQKEAIAARYAKDPNYRFVVDGEILDAAGEPEREFNTQAEDFRTRMPWGYCGNWIWEACRTGENRLYALECLDALRVLRGQASHEDALRKAWKWLMVCQHHDVQICGIETDAKRFSEACLRLLDGAKADIDAGSEAKTPFNPLPWARRDPQALLGGGCGEIPALGCIEPKTTAPGRFLCEAGALKTPYYAVSLCKDGGFGGITRLSDGRALFADGRRSGYLVGTVEGAKRVSQGAWTVSIDKHRAVAVDAGTVGGIPYAVTWTFYDKSPRVDVCVAVTLNGERVGRASEDGRDVQSAFVHEEKLRLKFYPALDESAVGLRDLPFGVTETKRTYLEGGLWTALCDGARGFAIFNKGAMGSVREDDGGLSVPVAFSMYYIWNSVKRDPLSDERALEAQKSGEAAPREKRGSFLRGRYETHAAILPFDGGWAEAELPRRAMEYNIPCLPVTAETAALIEGALEIDAPRNVYLASIFAQGGETFLRAYELEGGAGELAARANGREASVSETDLFGEHPTEAAPSARMTPHRIATIRVNA